MSQQTQAIYLERYLVYTVRITNLVGVALHGDRERAAQTQVGDLENVSPLVHEQILRLEVPE